MSLSPIESYARTHAILCSVGFLILLPLGSLIARYSRTFTSRWFWSHATIQLLISGPVIIIGWSKGYGTAEKLGVPHFRDPHQQMGLSLLILYVLQSLLGIFIHYVKLPTLGQGKRPVQNYFHAFLGLVILILAARQVQYGMQIEWLYMFGTKVSYSAIEATIACVVIFWVLYFIGLAFLPKQLRQEKRARQEYLGDHIPLNG
ncbi:hypothetical protein C8J56DRAFT_968778 [Mycena floridula]|nr:hypothetical protein C8J56DRAFT_968778 [Mycena floridula]